MPATATPSIESLTARHGAPPDLARRQDRAKRIVGYGVAGGIAADLLLRTPAVGANVALCLLILVAGVVGLSRRMHGALLDEQREPLAAAILFALALLLRDSAMLAAWNIAFSLGALAFAAMLAAPEPPAPLGRLRVGAAIAHAARIVPEAIFGAFPFLHREAPLTVAGHTRHLLAARLVAKAVLVSLVIGGVLVALLRAGDAVFAQATDSLVAWDPVTAVLHVTFSALFAWPIVGWLHRWSSFHATPALRRFNAPSLEATAILAGMNVVFTAFLGVQVRVLFGGQAYVQSVTGLTLAEYARSGFFALTAATAFVLLVLLVLDGTATRGSLAATPRHRTLGVALVGMVALLLGSAMTRMWIYIQSFGLSTDRLYAMVAMLWITMALVGFAATVLRGRGTAFTGVAVRSAWGVLLALNLANPDALVTRVNVDRARSDAAFDMTYHASLGADAVPAFVALLAESPDSCAVTAELRSTYGSGTPTRLRGWNLGYARARAAVQEHEAALGLVTCPPAPPR